MKHGENRHMEQTGLPAGAHPSREELDAMSAAALARALEDAFDAMTEENYDDARIRAYLDALDRAAPLGELPDREAELARFWRGVARAIPPQYAPARPRPRRLVRAGLAAAMAAVLLLGGMVAAQAAGVDVFGAMARWTRDTFQFTLREEGGADWLLDWQEELSAERVSQDALPTWIPEGYRMEKLQIDELKGRSNAYALYWGEDGTRFDILISVVEDLESLEYHIFEKDDTPVRTVQMGDKTVYLFENLGDVIAVWQKGNMIYSLCGELPQETILKILSSVEMMKK